MESEQLVSVLLGISTAASITASLASFACAGVAVALCVLGCVLI